MNAQGMVSLAGACVLFAVSASAAPLPCVQKGSKRWPIKTTLPTSAKSVTMTLDDALKLQVLTDVKTDDPRYQDKRITDQPVNEDKLVTVSGYLYLAAFEADDCDFHIQISPKPLTSTAKPTAGDNSMIVEVPSGEYATTISDQVEAARQWVIDNLLAKTPPKIGSVHVMQHVVYVTVTGALFYDDAHEEQANGSTGRGKKGLESKTLWELHPVTKIAFAPVPK
jgi:hypothetical protein